MGLRETSTTSASKKAECGADDRSTLAGTKEEILGYENRVAQ